MHLAAIHCCCWYQNGVQKVLWRTITSRTSRSPHRSARRQAIALALKDSRVRQIPHKNLHFHVYKIQVVFELRGQDKVKRLQFCDEFLELVNNNRDLVNSLLMSDEAHFQLSGFVNEQNNRCWGQTNPQELNSVLCILKKWQCGVHYVPLA